MGAVIVEYLLGHLPFSTVLLILVTSAVFLISKEIWKWGTNRLSASRADVQTAEKRLSLAIEGQRELLDALQELREEYNDCLHLVWQRDSAHALSLAALRDLIYGMREKCTCGEADCAIREAVRTSIEQKLADLSTPTE